jgi:hypothetical protein
MLKCVTRLPAGDRATHLFGNSRLRLTGSTNTRILITRTLVPLRTLWNQNAPAGFGLRKTEVKIKIKKKNLKPTFIDITNSKRMRYSYRVLEYVIHVQYSLSLKTVGSSLAERFRQMAIPCSWR